MFSIARKITEEVMHFEKTTVSLGLLASWAMVMGCATAPATNVDRQNLRRDADATLAEMVARDPAVRDVTRTAPAYVVFPSVGKGGALVGGAYGKGILYEGGVATGYVSLEQASIGAQLGGQSFAELLVLRNPVDVDDVKSGHYTVGANLGVVVLSPEASAQKGFDSNASVFVLPRGGLMVDISINGQQLKYQSFSA
ncbi:MAG TPA: lipid-binding SYLF domain-containing protein [Kofleriaceae bacterium]